MKFKLSFKKRIWRKYISIIFVSKMIIPPLTCCRTNIQLFICMGFPGGPEVKNLPAIRRHRFDPWVRKIPCRRAWQLTPVFLPGESHGQRSLVGYSSQCRKWVGLDLVTKTTTIYLYNWNMKDVLRYLL